MDSEKKDGPKDFGKVIDILHNKAKLSSLRTYQGDVAEFMKEKNESVISVAIKEKAREEKREEKEEKIEPTHKPKQGNFQINLTMLVLSIVLIMGGTMAFFYIFQYINRPPLAQIPNYTEIIPYNNLITLANIDNKNLGPELQKLTLESGINLVKISDKKGHLLAKAEEFLDFLEVSTTITLRRTLKDNFAVGVNVADNQNATFLIITVNDFGQAFASMLDWEESIPKDLSFLNMKNKAIEDTIASTTVSIKPDILTWKDLIVKNKDTRALVNQKNQAQIAYTFLDKNTILITNNLSAVGDISSIYASRSVVR